MSQSVCLLKVSFSVLFCGKSCGIASYKLLSCEILAWLAHVRKPSSAMGDRVWDSKVQIQEDQILF